MNEIYKLIEYDLIDIQFLDSMSKLKIFLIWSDYEESRVTLEIDELIHVAIHKLSSREGKNKSVEQGQVLPFAYLILNR